MKILYSCLVDAAPKFELQAALLLESLKHNASVDPASFIAHCTPGVSDDFRRFILRAGAMVKEVEPFPNHVYCNKITQLSSPVLTAFDKVVLCDCDLFFLQKPEIESITTPLAGKVVDLPNPPLEILNDVFRDHEIDLPPICRVDFAARLEDLTVETNWNGGFYIMDGDLIAEFGRRWTHNAKTLIEDIGRLGRYKNHVDQISFALTVGEMDLPYTLLPKSYNFPTHLSADLLAARTQRPDYVALHYHHKISPQGYILPSEDSYLNGVIDQANETLQVIHSENTNRAGGEFDALVNHWGDLVEERVA